MAKGKGNAGDWTYGDMLNNQAELDSVNEPEWLVLSQDELTETQYKRVIGALERNASKNGLVIGVVEHRDRRGNITGYQVSVERKNPKYKRGGKGAGKRKFI